MNGRLDVLTIEIHLNTIGFGHSKGEERPLGITHQSVSQAVVQLGAFLIQIQLITKKRVTKEIVIFEPRVLRKTFFITCFIT